MMMMMITTILRETVDTKEHHTTTFHAYVEIKSTVNGTYILICKMCSSLEINIKYYLRFSKIL
jgi:hypothetical protein